MRRREANNAKIFGSSALFSCPHRLHHPITQSRTCICKNELRTQREKDCENTRDKSDTERTTEKERKPSTCPWYPTRSTSFFLFFSSFFSFPTFGSSKSLRLLRYAPQATHATQVVDVARLSLLGMSALQHRCGLV